MTRRDPRNSLRERLIAGYSADGVVLCGSGTEALQVALRRALRDADARDGVVALPAFTCYDVAAAAVRIADGIALYDIDPITLGPDSSSLQDAFARGVRVAVVSPLYGIPVDWDGLESIAARHGAILVEDAAQGHGACWRGAPLGALGTFSVLSFGRGKGWTGGRGGAVLVRGRSESHGTGGTDMERKSGPVDEMVVAVMATAQWVLARRGLYGLPASIPWLGLGETVYHDAAPVRELTRFAAELVAYGADTSAEEATQRRRNARWLLDAVAGTRAAEPIRTAEDAEPGYLRLPVRFHGGLGGLADSAAARRAGIAASYPTTLMELDPVRRRLIHGLTNVPGARELASDLITLPTHSGLTDADRAAVIRQLAGRSTRGTE